MLAIILSRAKSNGQVCGVVPHLTEGAKNMKMILCMFEELSGLKINFHKSEIFCFGQAKECESLYSNLFGCKVGEYPFRYLGVPLHFRKLNNKDWKLIEDRIEKKLSNWKGKMLSYSGRLNNSHKKKYRLEKWHLLCNEEGMWQELIKNKYLKGKPLESLECQRPLSKLREVQTCQREPIKVLGGQMLTLFAKKHTTVADVFRSSPLNISFRRGLVGNKLQEWHNLVANLMFVNLEEGNDTFVWGLDKSGSFSVKSMYNSLINNGIVVSQEIWHFRIPLKIKIFLWFLKRGVFLTKDNLSKRNWIGRTSCEFCNQPESIQHFWSQQGRQNKVGMLLAGAAALCWALWLTRNDILFNKCKHKYILGIHWLHLGLSCSVLMIRKKRGMQEFRVFSYGVFFLVWMAF
ncbi:hypothetical protein U9M48_001463, partial [Paspalum notatum var. saurae]